MNKKLIFIWIFVLQFSFSAILVSQSKWKDGYIINLENDTIIGKIRDSRITSKYSVEFINKDSIKSTYDAIKLKAYLFDDKFYESIYFRTGYIFVERIIQGKINLYNLNGRYFLKKDKKDAVKLNDLIFKSVILDNIKDYDELYEREKAKQMGYSQIKKIVSEYNEWYIINELNQENFDSIGQLSLNNKKLF